MDSMFRGTAYFNQPLSNWAVSKVTKMTRMFEAAKNFNQPLDAWDVSKVKTMVAMFRGCDNFNQILSSWDVIGVTSMTQMFASAVLFNQDISTWDVGSVKWMPGMLWGATSFNQCLDTWSTKTPADIKVAKMFLGSSCPNTQNPNPSTGSWCQYECTSSGVNRTRHLQEGIDIGNDEKASASASFFSGVSPLLLSVCLSFM